MFTKAIQSFLVLTEKFFNSVPLHWLNNQGGNMITEHLVDISRLQFAVTVLYHFLFVPLTLGMVWLLVIMESMYVMTGKTVWKDMTRFWGKLFGINFALGVTTGITMEFQFGTNWAYYSHYVGDVFGAPLAIEGLMAFFLESTMVGLFFFGWDRLSRGQHLLVTIMMALGTNLSALWMLIANGWMQSPVGAEFSYLTQMPKINSCIPYRQVTRRLRHLYWRFRLGICSKGGMWSLPNAVSKSLPLLALRPFVAPLCSVMSQAIQSVLPSKPSLRRLKPCGKPNLRLQTLT